MYSVCSTRSSTPRRAPVVGWLTPGGVARYQYHAGQGSPTRSFRCGGAFRWRGARTALLHCRGTEIDLGIADPAVVGGDERRAPSDPRTDRAALNEDEQK